MGDYHLGTRWIRIRRRGTSAGMATSPSTSLFNIRYLDVRSMFWCVLTFALLLTYLVSSIGTYEGKTFRRIKQKAEANPSALARRHWSFGVHVTKHGVAEEVRGNIVYPQVDTSIFPTVNVSECPSMMNDIELAPAFSMPLTALASYPRSGNTWSRFLLQIATGFYTGSVFWKTEAHHKVFKGGSENYTLQKGVCVKTHHYDEDHIASFGDGAILLIRNPYFSLISEFIRIYGRLKNVSEPDIITSLKENDNRWTKTFQLQSTRWRNTSLNWINCCKRLMIVFYEDLAKNPVRELTRMVAFLGQPIQPKRIQCAVYNYKPMNGSQHKNKLKSDPYTPKMYKHLNRFIAEINKTLIQKHAVPLPTYTKYLPGK